MKEHKHRFTSWLMDQNIPDGTTIDEQTLKRLASGPSARVTTWQAYDINGQTFYTNAKDKKSACQNSGVRIDAVDATTGLDVTYYGFIEDTWELEYEGSLQIPVFRCQWVKHPQGVDVDNYGLTIVDLAKVGYKDDPWVLAKRVAQVLLIPDPGLKNQKHVVASGKQSIIGVDGVNDAEAFNDYDDIQFFTDLPTKIKEVEASIKGVKPWVRNDGEARVVMA